MAFPQGINFRSTTGFVTDVSPEDPEISDGGSYPRTTAQGNTVGWENGSGTAQPRNRNAGNDRRLAGMVFGSIPSNVLKYRIDLPASGSYNIRLAVGDANYAQSVVCDLYDTTTLVAHLTTGSTSAANSFKDATNTEYTAANWPGSNSPSTQTFSSTICRFQSNGSVDLFLAHLRVDAIAGGQTVDTPLQAAKVTNVNVGPPVLRRMAMRVPAYLLPSPVTDQNFIQPTYPACGKQTGPSVLRRQSIHYYPQDQQAPITDVNFEFPVYPASKNVGPTTLRTTKGQPSFMQDQRAPVSDANFEFPVYPASKNVGPTALRITKGQPYYLQDNQAPIVDANFEFPAYPALKYVGPTALRSTKIQPYYIQDQQATPTDANFEFPVYPASKNVGPMALRATKGQPFFIQDQQATITDSNFEFPVYPTSRFVGPTALRITKGQPFFIQFGIAAIGDFLAPAQNVALISISVSNTGTVSLTTSNTGTPSLGTNNQNSISITSQNTGTI